MARCSDHRIIEPCFYCQHGIQPFSSTAAHLDAVEERLRMFSEQLRGTPDRIFGVTENLDLSQAVAVIRDYALGDLVMLSASLKALKEQEPERPLVLLTRPELFDVLAGAPYLDAQLPKVHYERSKFYKTFDLCGAVETEAGGKLAVDKFLTQTRPDLFAELLGVPGGAESFPVPVNHEARAKMQAILAGCRRPLIGLAGTCNSTVRTIPPEYVEPLALKLIESYGGTVILVGKTNKWNTGLTSIRAPHLINLIDTLNVQELIAATSLMNAMISPDSGTMHVAGALGVKCLALMGNNNPKNFSDFYPSVKVLQPTKKELPCIPCNDRSIPCAPKMKHQYGAECMRLMTPERTLEAFRKFFNGKNIAYLHDTTLDFVGGAEITTKGMIKAGREMGYNIRLFDNKTPPEQLYSLYGYDLIILSNIWRFSKEAMAIIMKVVRSVPYVKYEHDHDGLGNAPQGYPKEKFAEKIYRESALNIFVSPAHMADYAALGDGICIPELIDTEMFKPVKGVKRKKAAIIAVPGKWSPDVLKKKQIHGTLRVDTLLAPIPHLEMPKLFSEYEEFLHFPARKWPCDRVIYEAALCGCKVTAGEIVEAMSWEKDLTDTEGLRSWLKAVPGQFWAAIDDVIEKTHG